jgi:hypothetical protein
MRRRLLLAAALVFASLALVPVGLTGAVGGADGAAGTAADPLGPVAAEAQTCGGSVANVSFARTEGVERVNATGAILEGMGQVGLEPATGWFEYRSVGATEWRTTERQTDEPDACGRVRFEAPVDGLARNRSYEYRVVVATDDDTARGNVSRFRTASETTEGASETPTPDPCPQFRGVGSLCTGTPTPHEGDGVTPATTGDVGEVGPDRDRGPLGWSAGLVPLLAWVAVVAVLAPLVLGGLVGLDSLRGRR